MEAKKRKREDVSGKEASENVSDDDEDGHFKVKRHLVHAPSPPSPPEDSNDREVSMILGYNSARETTTNTSSQHYSKHSSLLTDLSLTPSPPTNTLPQEENTQPPIDDDDEIDDDDNDDDDEDSLDANVSSSTHDQSSLDSTEELFHLPEPGVLSRTMGESLSTPQELPDPPSTHHQFSTPEPDPEEAISPHFNTPEPAIEEAPNISSTCVNLTSTPVQTSNFHDDILRLCPDLSPAPSDTLHQSEISILPPKSYSINNNLGPSPGTPVSPSYCGQSPVYSIPSPGSAFSIVINRRRESES